MKRNNVNIDYLKQRGFTPVDARLDISATIDDALYENIVSKIKNGSKVTLYTHGEYAADWKGLQYHKQDLLLDNIVVATRTVTRAPEGSFRKKIFARCGSDCE